MNQGVFLRHRHSSVNFQDIPTGFENVNDHEESEIVAEEGVSRSREAQEEEQEAFITSKTDGEVICS